jgi:hypothetical protein
LGIYFALVALAAWPAIFMPNAFVQGLIVGLAVAGAAGAVASLVIIQTGTGPTMAGELAEQWTVEELKDLLKHGHRLVNHVVIDGRGDVDHVLVGPAGLFVLETKWSATPYRSDDPRLLDTIGRLERRAHNTRLRFKRLGAETVTPVLVLWGPAARHLAEGSGAARTGHTTVLAGRHLRLWMLNRPGGQLQPSSVQRLHEELAVLARSTDAREEPVPASVERLLQHGVALAATAAAAFLLPWVVAVHVHAIAILLAPLLLSIRVLGHRGRYATAVFVGGAVASMLAAGAYALELIARRPLRSSQRCPLWLALHDSPTRQASSAYAAVRADERPADRRIRTGRAARSGRTTSPRSQLRVRFLVMSPGLDLTSMTVPPCLH